MKYAVAIAALTTVLGSWALLLYKLPGRTRFRIPARAMVLIGVATNLLCGALARPGGVLLMHAALAGCLLAALFSRTAKRVLIWAVLSTAITGSVLVAHSGSVGESFLGVVTGGTVLLYGVILFVGLLDRGFLNATPVLLRICRKEKWAQAGYVAGVVALSALVFRSKEPMFWLLALVVFAGCVAFAKPGYVASGAVGGVLVVSLLLGSVVNYKEYENGKVGPAVQTEVLVDVTTTQSEDSKALDACAQMGQAQYLAQKDCYSAYFIERGDKVGTSAALEELVKFHQEKEGSSFRPHCHEVLHDFAKDRAAKDGVESLLGEYRITCTGGFAHGILVSYTDKVGWGSIEKNLTTFCKDLTTKVVDAMMAKGKPRPSETGWLEWNCNHMLGHVVYENTRADMNAGAQLCTKFAEGTTERRNCGAGFFMEHFLDVTRGQNGWTMPKDKSQIFKSCEGITGSIKEVCYAESGIAVSVAANYNYSEAFALCKNYAPEAQRRVCYSSVGRIVVVTSGYVPDKSVAECRKGLAVDPVATYACTAEVALAMLNETFAIEAAEKVCATIGPKNERDLCDERRLAQQKQMAGSGATGGTGEARA